MERMIEAMTWNGEKGYGVRPISHHVVYLLNFVMDLTTCLLSIIRMQRLKNGTSTGNELELGRLRGISPTFE